MHPGDGTGSHSPYGVPTGGRKSLAELPADQYLQVVKLRENAADARAAHRRVLEERQKT